MIQSDGLVFSSDEDGRHLGIVYSILQNVMCDFERLACATEKLDCAMMKSFNLLSMRTPSHGLGYLYAHL